MFDERKFKACVALKGSTMFAVAKVLHIHVATLYRKIQRGGDFTRKEIETLCDFLEVDDPRPVFFVREQ